MKQISVFVFGFAMAFASASAPAQDLTAGKTPAQLFHSDCAECHRSPSGLARTRDVRALADFLREHYTSKSETAGALAAYVSSFAAGATHNRGAGATAPAAGGYREVGRQNRGEGEATVNGGDATSQARPAKNPDGRHRRTTRLSGESEKGGVDSDGEVPRPPGGILTTPASSKSNARTRGREHRDARSRFDSPSERGSENAAEEAGKKGAPTTARKRRNRVNPAPAPDTRAKIETSTDRPSSDASGPTVPGMP